MVMFLWSPLRRWWQTAFAAAAPWGVDTSARPAVRPVVRLAQARRSITPFQVPARRVSSTAQAQRAARHFWMRLDPQDQRHAAIGGSFAEVCAALEKLAAIEEMQA